MRPVVLRRGAEVADPLEVAVGFLEKWAYEADVDASPMSFEEADLRRANRGGARISAAEIAAILERRREIERALRALERTRPWPRARFRGRRSPGSSAPSPGSAAWGSRR